MLTNKRGCQEQAYPNMTIELIWDKSDCAIELKGVSIHAAPWEHPPFIYQAIVEEQDTNLLLTPQTHLTDPGKPAWYLANTLTDATIHKSGTVVLKGQQPKRLLAIVHDIELNPTCQPEIIAHAWQSVFDAIEENQFTVVATPLLGTVHGKISIQESLLILNKCLQQTLPSCLKKMWLILPQDSGCELLVRLIKNDYND